MTFLYSLIAFLFTAHLTAIGYLAANKWFGVGDLKAFLFWSLILAAPVTPLALLTGRLLAGRPAIQGYGLSVLAGAVMGYGATMIVMLMLGPMFGAFSFPVFYCWVVGAVSACCVATACKRRTERKQQAVN